MHCGPDICTAGLSVMITPGPQAINQLKHPIVWDLAVYTHSLSGATHPRASCIYTSQIPHWGVLTNSCIIDDIRDSETNQISREHLVSKKDISNIKKQYNIEGIRRYPNDLISVAEIVNEMEDLYYNPVILFKQQGEPPSNCCTDSAKENFLLVLQTEFQSDMLCRHGRKGVCMDATYKINDYDFNLITLMVLDDFQEGGSSNVGIIQSRGQNCLSDYS